MKNRGFTFVELFITFVVLTILAAFGIRAFYSATTSKNLDTITDGLQFALGHAKSDAFAGKGATNFGVYIASTSFTYFTGSTYSSTATTNVATYLPGNWQLSTSTGNGSTAIIFSRLTGLPLAAATVTVTYLKDSSVTRKVTVGAGGNISVIK